MTGRRTAGTSSATRTRSGSSPSTATTPTSSASSTRTSRRPGRRRRSSSGTRTGCASSSATSAPGCTSTTASGCTCSPTPTAGRPTNMHNNAISVNSMHRIRAAQDLALYNLTLSEEIDGFDGTAHLETWNSDPAWQGVREVAEQLTGIDDWCEAIFAANVVFEPLVGELFRSQPGAAGGAAQRRLRHSHGRRRGGVRLRRARPALHHGDVRAADQRPRVRRPQQGDHAGVAVGLGAAVHRGGPHAAAALVAARCEAAAIRGRPGRASRTGSAASCPTWTWKHRRSWHSDHVQDRGEPVQVRQHRVQHVRVHPDEQSGRRGGGRGHEHQAQRARACRCRR